MFWNALIWTEELFPRTIHNVAKVAVFKCTIRYDMIYMIYSQTSPAFLPKTPHRTTRCNTLQRTTTHYNTLQHTGSAPMHSITADTPQHTTIHCNAVNRLESTQLRPTNCNTLCRTATHYKKLKHSQCTHLRPTLCNTLQHSATLCNTLNQLHALTNISRPNWSIFKVLCICMRMYMSQGLTSKNSASSKGLIIYIHEACDMWNIHILIWGGYD